MADQHPQGISRLSSRGRVDTARQILGQVFNDYDWILIARERGGGLNEKAWLDWDVEHPAELAEAVEQRVVQTLSYALSAVGRHGLKAFKN